MVRFHIDAKTALRLCLELGFKPNRFTSLPHESDRSLFGVNFNSRMVYHTTRTNKPRLKLTFDQVCELVLTPVEAHEELLRVL